MCRQHRARDQQPGLGYETVEGSSTYLYDKTAYFTGEIVDGTRHDANQSSYEIIAETDSDGDDVIETESATFDGDAETFAYKISQYMQTGSVTFRIIEHVFVSGQPGESVEGTGDAQSYFHAPPDNYAPEFRFAAVEHYNPYGGYVWGEFIDFTRRNSEYLVEVDGDGDGHGEVSVNMTDPGAFNLGGYIMPGVTPRVRVTETAGFGVVLTTGWVAAGGALPANVAPQFDPAGDYDDMIFYGDLTAGDPVGAVTANDVDDLKYRVNQPLYTIGQQGSFSMTLPVKGVEINETTGAVTVNSIDGLRLLYREDGKYTFTITADDGQTTSSAGFTIYDNGRRWIDEAENLVANWYGAYTNALGETRDAAEDAIAELDALTGFEGIAAVERLVDVFWATIPVQPVYGAAATGRRQRRLRKLSATPSPIMSKKAMTIFFPPLRPTPRTFSSKAGKKPIASGE